MSESRISHARSDANRWARRWTVGGKMAAVLVVPLASAVMLGALAISASAGEASRLRDTADGVQFVPIVNAVASTHAAVAFSQSAGLVRDEDLGALAKAIAEAEVAAAGREVPGGRTRYEMLLKQARDTLNTGKQRATTGSEVRERAAQVWESSAAIAGDALAPATAAPVAPHERQLIDAINTAGALFPEGMSMLAYLRQEDPSPAGLLAAVGTERQLLAMLARRYPATDPAIMALRDGLEFRAHAANSSGARPNTQELVNSYLASSVGYAKLTTDAAQTIVSSAERDAAAAHDTAIRNAVLAALALAVTLAVAVFAIRSLVQPLRRLREAAQRAASTGLPAAVERVMNGASVAEQPDSAMPVRSADEVGQLARAVDSMQDQALRLAADQAQLRRQVNGMFETLARRNKSLVDHQLLLIEQLEQNEKDPVLLDGLFRLDNLAARMRRNGENLLILAGTQAQRTRSGPVEIPDVLRAAISEVEEYERVKFGGTPRRAISAAAATDIAHLIAELLDNALRASPPETDVRFTFAQATDEGLLIEVADRGIGIPAGQMEEINAALRSEPVVSSGTARHMGLFVVGKLAARHGLGVWMRPTFRVARDPGVTVTLHIPRGLLVDMASVVPAAHAGPPRYSLTGLAPAASSPMAASVAAPAAGPAWPAQAPAPARRVPAPAPIPPAEPATPTPPRSWPAVVAPAATDGDRAADRPPVPSESLFVPPQPEPARLVPNQPQQAIRPDLGRAATYFSARRRNAPPPRRTAPGTPPIYAEMMSAWLSEPAAGRRSFDSPADAGWAAAGRRAERAPAGPGMAGLPRRVPGQQLVPGRIDQDMDPAAVRPAPEPAQARGPSPAAR